MLCVPIIVIFLFMRKRFLSGFSQLGTGVR